MQAFQLNLLLFQGLALFVIHLLLHPDSPVTPLIEKLFKSYGSMLNLVNGGQIILIAINAAILFWGLL